MTSIGICRGLQIEPKLRVDSFLSEFLSDMLFEEGYPLDKLAVKSVDDLRNLIKADILPKTFQIDWDYDPYSEQIKSVFPEEDISCRLRTLAVHTNSMDQIDQFDKAFNKKIFMVHVTHYQSVYYASDINGLYQKEKPEFLDILKHFKDQDFDISKVTQEQKDKLTKMCTEVMMESEREYANCIVEMVSVQGGALQQLITCSAKHLKPVEQEKKADKLAPIAKANEKKSPRKRSSSRGSSKSPRSRSPRGNK